MRKPGGPLSEDGPESNLLIVEGPDDFHTFTHLFDHYNLKWKCRIQDGGGFESIRGSLGVRVDESNLERLGIVIDANHDIAARWQSIRDAVDELGYVGVPESPNPIGTIIEEPERVTIGIWLMPNNTIVGALEDFAKLLIRESDMPLFDMAQQAVTAIPAGLRKFTDTGVMKANIHTWLAWQEEPGKPIGQAITKKYLDAEAEHAKLLIDWIRQLFKLEVVGD